MSDKFDPYAINPNDYISIPPVVQPTSEDKATEEPTGQTNLVANQPPAVPRGKANEFLTQAVGTAIGAGAGALTNAEKIANFLNVPEKAKYQYSTDFPSSSAGRPLTKFELSTPEGQAVEKARLELQDSLGKWKAKTSAENILSQNLRTEAQRAQDILGAARLAEREATYPYVMMGGKTAPRLPVAPTVEPAVSAAPNLLEQVSHTIVPADLSASSLARETGQHELAHYRSLMQKYNVNTLEELAQKVGLPAYNDMMRQAGLHLPTATGNVLLRPQELQVLGTPAQQQVSAMSAEERARLAEQQRLAAIEAQRLAQQERIRALRFAEAERVYQQAKSGTNVATTASRKAEEDLLNQLGLRGTESAKIAPEVELAQQRLVSAKSALPSTGALMSKAAMKALPIAGNVLTAAGAGELGGEAYNRWQRHDPVGAAIAGIGSAVGSVGLLPSWQSKAVGALGDVGAQLALAGYDIANPVVYQWLEDKGIISSKYNPNKYSVMDEYPTK